jgi:uncharacterized membrane protein
LLQGSEWPFSLVNCSLVTGLRGLGGDYICSSSCCDFATLQFTTTASLVESERLVVCRRLLNHSDTIEHKNPVRRTLSRMLRRLNALFPLPLAQRSSAMVCRDDHHLAVLAAIGGALVHRGVTGHCYGYDALGINTRERNTSAGTRGADGIKVTQSVIIRRSPAEIYQFWRRLENLPLFMKHVETVEPIDDVRSRWVVKGPVGSEVEWTARILADRENEVISWESLPGADVQNAGSVWFEPAGNGGTEVRVILRYYPPTGRLGAAVAELVGDAPDQQLAEDLQRLKETLEVGSAAIND